MRKTLLKKLAVGAMALSLLGAYAPTIQPTVTFADEVDLDNPDYNAYIGIQTPKYSFRNEFNEENYGLEGSSGADYFKVHCWGEGNELQDMTGDITDAKIDGNGTYTVKIENLEFADDEFATQEKMNLIFISTDIPKSDAITISDVVLKIDGTEVSQTGAVNDEDADYLQYQIQSLWSEDPAIVDIGYYPVPFSTIEITFTVGGFNKDSEQVAETEAATETVTEAAASSDDANSSTKSDTKKDSKESDDSGVNAGLVGGIAVAVIAVIAIILLVLKKKK